MKHRAKKILYADVKVEKQEDPKQVMVLQKEEPLTKKCTEIVWLTIYGFSNQGIIDFIGIEDSV